MLQISEKRICYFSQRNSYGLFLNKSANRWVFLSGFKITTVRIEQKNHENKLLTSQKKLLFARAFYSLFLFPLRVYQLFYVERNIRGNFPCPLETKNHPYEFTQLTFLFPSSFFKFTLFNLLISCPDLLLTKLTRDLGSRLANNTLHKRYSNEQNKHYNYD